MSNGQFPPITDWAPPSRRKAPPATKAALIFIALTLVGFLLAVTYLYFTGLPVRESLPWLRRTFLWIVAGGIGLAVVERLTRNRE
jgi:hypothetical protein